MACDFQIIRSVSQWSAGTSQIEESIHKAYCSLIDRAEHIVYIEVELALISNLQLHISKSRYFWRKLSFGSSLFKFLTYF